MIVLAGCSEAAPAAQGTQIECAIGEGSEFEPVCILEKISTSEVVLHGPEGSFRRLTLGENGRYSPADGAEDIVVLAATGAHAGFDTIAFGDDRYHIPRAEISEAVSGD